MDDRRWLANGIIPMACGMLLNGCNKAPDEPRTVSYFQEHADERQTLVKKCEDDPGGVGKTRACINAMQAQMRADFGSLRNLPPMNLSKHEHDDNQPHYKPDVR
jgi:hypothetical protein